MTPTTTIKRTWVSKLKESPWQSIDCLPASLFDPERSVSQSSLAVIRAGKLFPVSVFLCMPRLGLDHSIKLVFLSLPSWATWIIDQEYTDHFIKTPDADLPQARWPFQSIPAEAPASPELGFRWVIFLTTWGLYGGLLSLYIKRDSTSCENQLWPPQFGRLTWHELNSVPLVEYGLVVVDPLGRLVLVLTYSLRYHWLGSLPPRDQDEDWLERRTKPW